MLSQTKRPSHAAKVKWTRCKSQARYSRCRGRSFYSMIIPVCTVFLPCICVGVSCFSRRQWVCWGSLLFSASSPAPRTAPGTQRGLGKHSLREGRHFWTQNSSKKPSLRWEDDSEGCHGNQSCYRCSALQQSHYVPHKNPAQVCQVLA